MLCDKHNDTNRDNSFVTCGDLNNDGKDEVIVANEKWENYSSYHRPKGVWNRIYTYDDTNLKFILIDERNDNVFTPWDDSRNLHNHVNGNNIIIGDVDGNGINEIYQSYSYKYIAPNGVATNFPTVRNNFV